MKTKTNKQSDFDFFAGIILGLIVACIVTTVLYIGKDNMVRYCEINQGKGDINCLLSENY